MKAQQRQIIAVGGGGLEPENAALNVYILAQARRAKPSVCFIPTASGDADSDVARFYTAFTKLKCQPMHVPLFGRTPDLREILLSQDVIYVGARDWR